MTENHRAKGLSVSMLFCIFVKNSNMEQLVITIEGKSNTDLLMRLLTKFNFVKSISRETTPKQAKVQKKIVNEPTEAYNWTNPSRTATDEEFENLVLEIEKDKGEYSVEEVMSFVNEELSAWRKKKK